MTLDTTPRLVAVAAAVPLVWLAHLSANYALVPVACAAGTRAPLHAVFAVALVATVAMALAVARAPQRGGAGDDEDSGWQAVRRAVAVEAGVFVVAVLLLGLPNVLVDPCA